MFDIAVQSGPKADASGSDDCLGNFLKPVAERSLGIPCNQGRDCGSGGCHRIRFRAALHCDVKHHLDRALRPHAELVLKRLRHDDGISVVEPRVLPLQKLNADVLAQLCKASLPGLDEDRVSLAAVRHLDCLCLELGRRFVDHIPQQIGVKRRESIVECVGAIGDDVFEQGLQRPIPGALHERESDDSPSYACAVVVACGLGPAVILKSGDELQHPFEVIGPGFSGDLQP